MMNRRRYTITLWIAAVVVVLSSAAQACSVPVFRWALERWEPDPYELVVFHEGPLSEADEAILNDLEKQTHDMDHPANLYLRQIDLAAAPGEDWQALWKSQSDATLPWAVLRYPNPHRNPLPIWSGALSSLPREGLLDSPVRKKLAEQILDGECAVWLFLESGTADADAAAFKRLEDCLKEATSELTLPDMAGDPVLSEPGAPDVSDMRISFSIIRLARNDPAEAILIRMLLGTESDLATLKGPMAFPIFGRGRALYAFVDTGINMDTIGPACAFLVGSCSCEVKAQNPGTDLLMAVDWESGLDGFQVIREIELPPLPGMVQPSNVETDTEEAADSLAKVVPEAPLYMPDVIVEPEPLPTARTEKTALLTHMLVALGAVLGVVVLTAVVLSRRKNF